MGRLSGGTRYHQRGRSGHGHPGQEGHVRQHPAQGRRRRQHPQQLQGHRAGPAEARRRKGATRRTGAGGQRLDRHHRHRPATHGNPRAALGGDRAFLRVRRRDRGRAAGDSRWSVYRGRSGYLAAHRSLRSRALFRPAGGHTDRSRYRRRLRAFRGEPVPGGDRRRLRHRGRGPPHGDDGRPHGRIFGGADCRVRGQPASVAAGFCEVAHLRAPRGGDASGAALDHAAAGLPGRPRSPRRRARRADAVPGALPAQLAGSRTACRRPRPAKRSRPDSGASLSTS